MAIIKYTYEQINRKRNSIDSLSNLDEKLLKEDKYLKKRNLMLYKIYIRKN